MQCDVRLGCHNISLFVLVFGSIRRFLIHINLLVVDVIAHYSALALDHVIIFYFLFFYVTNFSLINV
jgi:hypothetical protein